MTLLSYCISACSHIHRNTLSLCLMLVSHHRVDTKMHRFMVVDWAGIGSSLSITIMWTLVPFTESVSYVDLLLPTMFYLVHRTSVALKYATLNADEYGRLRTCKNNYRIERYQQQMQIINSWWQMNPEVIEFNIVSSAAVCGADIDNTNFILPRPNDAFEGSTCLGNLFILNDPQNGPLRTPYAAWKAFLESDGVNIDNLPRNEDGYFVLSVHQFVTSIINKVVVEYTFSTIFIPVISFISPIALSFRTNSTFCLYFGTRWLNQPDL